MRKATRAPALMRVPGRPRTSAGSCGRLCGGGSLLTLSGGVARDADDPSRLEVNEMILKLEPRPDTETPSRTHSERTCETTPEETSRSVSPGAARKPQPSAGRPPGIHPRSTRRPSGRRWRRGCASWPGSSPAPTCGRLTGRLAKGRRSPALAYRRRRKLRGECGTGGRDCRRRPLRRQRDCETVLSTRPCGAATSADQGTRFLLNSSRR